MLVLLNIYPSLITTNVNITKVYRLTHNTRNCRRKENKRMNLENTPVLWLAALWCLGASLEHGSDKASAVPHSSNQGRGTVVLHTECVVQCYGAKNIESNICPSNTPIAPSLVRVYLRIVISMLLLE